MDANAEHHYLTMDDLQSINQRLAEVEAKLTAPDPELVQDDDDPPAGDDPPADDDPPVMPPTPDGETILDEPTADPPPLPSEAASSGRSAAGPLF